MLNITKIQDSLLGIVGFRQPLNPSYAILDGNNTASRSGYYVNDNPYAKVEFLKENNDYMNVSDIEFNEYLVRMQKSSIANVCNQVFDYADFIDRSVLYPYAFNKIESEALQNGFVGFKISVDNLKNVAFRISRVLLDFEGTGNIELLLWNTAKKTPLFSQVVNITSDHQEVLLDWVIDNLDTTYKGDYYIGYNTAFVDDVAPYKRDFEDGSIKNTVTYLTVENVYVPGHNANYLFDLREVESSTATCGINLDIVVYEDFTDLVLNNIFLFSRAIYLDMVIASMQVYLASLRSNKDQIRGHELYQKIIIEIEGVRNQDSAITVKGLRPQMLGEISTIKAQIDKLRENYFGIGYDVVTQE